MQQIPFNVQEIFILKIDKKFEKKKCVVLKL